jgi:iron complex outermembrane receptor protein
VVIGYGEVNKRDATGAVASVKADDFNRGVISSPEQLIQGKTAGVQITSASGEPGAGVNVRIRGTSSVRGGNDPLFVVDGIPLGGENVSSGGADFGRGTSSAKNPLNFINPNDIESIDILKDASATAIYGSRGANGVVIITTKSGRGRSKLLEYSTTFSISEQAKTFDLLGREEYLAAYEELGGDVVAQDKGADTDWQDEINRTALSQNHNVSFSNSYKTGDYRASLSYDDQEGIIKNSGMERITGRFNLNNSFFNEKLQFGAQLLFSRVNDQAAPITNSAGFEGDLLGSSIIQNPTLPATAEQIQGDVISNPLALLKYSSDNTETDRSLINLSLGYNITPELTFKVNTGFDRANSVRESAFSSRLININAVRGNGRAFINTQGNESDLLEAFGTYNKTLSNNNKLNIVLGYSYQQFRNEGRNVLGYGFTDHRMSAMIDDVRAADQIAAGYIEGTYQMYGYENMNELQIYSLDKIDAPIVLTPVTQTPVGGLPNMPIKSVIGSKFRNIDELQSFFGRGTYSLNDKYYFNASMRADGSTRFGGNNKYGFFPAASVKWRISEEDFAPQVFDDLALRVGFGITGNQSIPHNLHQGRIRWKAPGVLNGLGIADDGNINPVGTDNVSFANEDLKWEQTSQLSVGLDFSFLSGRINGSLDYYRKNTTDLLMQVTSAQPAPTAFVWQNLDANVINSGVELNLNYIAIENPDMGLDFGFNVAFNRNMVKNYSGSPLPTGRIHGQGLTGAFVQRIDNNQPLFAYFLRDFVGYDEDGLNADDDIQRYVDKSPIPKTNMGLSVNFRYKSWDLSTYLYGQFGHYVYNNVSNAFFTKGSIAGGRNVIPSVLNSAESPANAPDVSTRFLEKGDFVRMQNLSLGYSFPLSQENFISKLRASVTAQNLFVITDYSGLDPEVNVDKNIDGVPSLGIDYTAYPRARTISFGISATF